MSLPFQNLEDPSLDVRCAAVEASLLALFRYFGDPDAPVPQSVSLSIEARHDGAARYEIDLAVSIDGQAVMGLSL